ncbi:MAG: hypothetical protein GX050_01010, partial [Firmicutes bacterium]|nr:hypothetical protein [Bacillota bacterium]
MKGLRLIVAVLLLAVIFGVRPGSNLAAARLEEVVGAGEVVLGNGITLEQAEEMALIMAKRDALDQFGGYVISETVVTNHELTKDEVTAITAGIVQVKPGFKEVSKHLDGTYIVVRVKAVFLIDRADFEARLARYVEERTKSAEIAKLVERVNTMEAQLAALSKQADSSYLEAQLQISAVEQSYQDLSYALTFSGQTIFSLINDNRVQRLNRLKAYLTKLKGVADPYKMFTLSIEGQPLVEDKGEGAISITVNTKVDLNRDYCQKASRIVEEHKGDLYPVNDRVDNINSEVLGETPIFKQPLIVAFLNSNDEVVAFYYCRWPYGEYVSVEF